MLSKNHQSQKITLLTDFKEVFLNYNNGEGEELPLIVL